MGTYPKKTDVPENENCSSHQLYKMKFCPSRVWKTQLPSDPKPIWSFFTPALVKTKYLDLRPGKRTIYVFFILNTFSAFGGRVFLHCLAGTFVQRYGYGHVLTAVLAKRCEKTLPPKKENVLRIQFCIHGSFPETQIPKKCVFFRPVDPTELHNFDGMSMSSRSKVFLEKSFFREKLLNRKSYDLGN